MSDQSNPRLLVRASELALVGAAAAFLVSNLIHNDLGLDPAIVPMAALIALFFWRRTRLTLWLTALAIAAPAFLFLDLSAVGNPRDLKPFLNHVALLSAGALAVVSVLASLLVHRSSRER